MTNNFSATLKNSIFKFLTCVKYTPLYTRTAFAFARRLQVYFSLMNRLIDSLKVCMPDGHSSVSYCRLLIRGVACCIFIFSCCAVFFRPALACSYRCGWMRLCVRLASPYAVRLFKCYSCFAYREPLTEYYKHYYNIMPYPCTYWPTRLPITPYPPFPPFPSLSFPPLPLAFVSMGSDLSHRKILCCLHCSYTWVLRHFRLLQTVCYEYRSQSSLANSWETSELFTAGTCTCTAADEKQYFLFH